MDHYPLPMQRCLEALGKLPGLGRKSSQRILFHLLDNGPRATRELSEALGGLVEGVELCSSCRVYKTTGEPCGFCADPARDPKTMCIVETVGDVFLIEATGEYRGMYHALHGLLSPLKGIKPESLGLDLLKRRLEQEPVEEVILATPPTAEGEATASFLASLLSSRTGRVSRIAYGLPVGSGFQYVDAQTLSRSLQGRKEYLWDDRAKA